MKSIGKGLHCTLGFRCANEPSSWASVLNAKKVKAKVCLPIGMGHMSKNLRPWAFVCIWVVGQWSVMPVDELLREKADLFDFCHPHWVFSLQLNETKWVQVEGISERGLIVESNRIRFSQWNDGQQKHKMFQVHTCKREKKPGCPKMGQLSSTFVTGKQRKQADPIRPGPPKKYRNYSH